MSDQVDLVIAKTTRSPNPTRSIVLALSTSHPFHPPCFQSSSLCRQSQCEQWRKRILQTLQVHLHHHLACPRDGKSAPLNPSPSVLMPEVDGVHFQAPAMGRRPAHMVLRATSDRQVAMGDPNRTRRPDAFHNADFHRDWPLASTPFATIHIQSSGGRVWEDRRAVRFCGGERESFRRILRSLCLHTTWKSGTDGRLERPAERPDVPGVWVCWGGLVFSADRSLSIPKLWTIDRDRPLRV